MGFPELAAERKAQLRPDFLHSEVAATFSFTPQGFNTAPNQPGGGADLFEQQRPPSHSRISSRISQARPLDLILETPGGFRGRCRAGSSPNPKQVLRCVPSSFPAPRKSAGTIMAFAADEILMGPSSALGPDIDAQITWQGKVFSADALIKGFDKIKAEVDAEKTPSILRTSLSSSRSHRGELQHAQNALDFCAGKLVAQWLVCV